MPALYKDGKNYSHNGPQVDVELTKGSPNAAPSGKVYDKFEEVNTRLTQSFVEHEVGTYIDASGISHKMYEKTVNCGALPDNNIKDIPFSSTYSKIVSVSGMMYHQVTSGYDGHSVAIPCAWMEGGKFTSVQLYTYRDKIRLRTFNDASTYYTKSEVTVRYIKD